MSTHTKIIKVPKPKPGAYNPDRPISDLVRNQILHLSLAERHLHKDRRSGIDVYSIKTEREASEYIHHLTKELHPAGAAKPKAAKKTEKPRGKAARQK